ncbi:MAG: SRPBCC family protein [Acidimicrobiales bacterium]
MANPRDTVTVERVINASPEVIFELLANPSRHPEIDGSGSVRKAREGAPARLSKGASFGMDMRIGLPYGMLNTVTEFDPPRLIAWSPRPASRIGARFAGRIWRYELEPVEGGTRVRESWDISKEATRAVLRMVMATRTKRDMEKSLERLERLATGGA